MHNLTKKIGKSYEPKKLDTILEVKRILIARPNQRLGNLLLTTPLIQEITSVFPNCRVDLVVKGGLAPTLYKNYTNVDTIIVLPKRPFNNLFKYILKWFSVRNKRYDIAINGVIDSSSGKLLTLLAKSKLKIFGINEEEIKLQYKDQRHMAKYQVYAFREYLTKLGLKANTNPIDLIDLKLSANEIENGKKVLKDIVKNDTKTISIFTYATGEKCYSKSWWNTFYERLKKEYANNYNIIEVLPVENVSQISFNAPTFYSKDVREIASLIANTEVFIGADSGIMHLASSSLTPTVGLFSITDVDKYRPYGNNSSFIDTNIHNLDDSIAIINKALGT